MLELFLLFVGTRFIRRKWWVIGLAGLLWMALGVSSRPAGKST